MGRHQVESASPAALTGNNHCRLQRKVWSESVCVWTAAAADSAGGRNTSGGHSIKITRRADV